MSYKEYDTGYEHNWKETRKRKAKKVAMEQIMSDEGIRPYNKSKKVTIKIAESRKTLYYWTNLQIKYKKNMMLYKLYW